MIEERLEAGSTNPETAERIGRREARIRTGRGFPTEFVRVESMERSFSKETYRINAEGYPEDTGMVSIPVIMFFPVIRGEQ
jgi:hypothetical protein